MTKEDSERLLEVKIKFMSAILRATMAERWLLSIVFNIFNQDNF